MESRRCVSLQHTHGSVEVLALLVQYLLQLGDVVFHGVCGELMCEGEQRVCVCWLCVVGCAGGVLLAGWLAGWLVVVLPTGEPSLEVQPNDTRQPLPLPPHFSFSCQIQCPPPGVALWAVFFVVGENTFKQNAKLKLQRIISHRECTPTRRGSIQSGAINNSPSVDLELAAVGDHARGDGLVTVAGRGGLDLADHVHALNDGAEHTVLAIKPRGLRGAQEELAACEQWNRQKNASRRVV
jgi:hypothetical protein